MSKGIEGALTVVLGAVDMVVLAFTSFFGLLMDISKGDWSFSNVTAAAQKFINSPAIKTMLDVMDRMSYAGELFSGDEGLTHEVSPEQLKAIQAKREANRVANQAGASTTNSSSTTNNNSGGNNITINVDGGDRDEIVGTIKYAAGAAH
jgi:hypothetical protein